MKRIISFIISAVIVSVSMYGAIFAAEEGYKYNGNIANGGFEEGIWTKSGILRTDKVSLENGGRNGSEYALSVTRAKKTVNPAVFSSKTSVTEFDAEEKYCLEMYVKTSSNFSGVLYAELSQKGAAVISSAGLSMYLLGSAGKNSERYFENWYRLVSAPFSLRNGEVSVSVKINGTGTVIIDDVNICPDPEKENAVKNGGFENGLWQNQVSGGSYVSVSDEVTDGSLRSACITGAEGGNAMLLNTLSGIDINSAYNLSLSVKTENVNDSGVYVRILQTGTVNGTQMSKWLTAFSSESIAEAGGTEEWQTLTAECKRFEKWADNFVLYIYLTGKGAAYIDSVSLTPIKPYKYPETLEVVSNTPSGNLGTAKSVYLFTGDERDIYYTLDGTDPRFSNNAYLYDSADGIYITENVTLKAVAGKPQFTSRVSEFNYTVGGIVPGFNDWQSIGSAAVQTDGSIRLTQSSSADSGFLTIDSTYNYILRFKAKTQDLANTDSAYLSVFLSGTGTERHNGKSGFYAKSERGAFSFETTQDWTGYELDLNNLAGTYASICLTAGLDGAGSIWLRDFSLTAVPKNNRPLTVTDISEIGNIYHGESLADGTFTLYNKSGDTQAGNIFCSIVNKDGNTVYTFKSDINIKAYEKLSLPMNADKMTLYGEYSLSVAFEDKNGFSYNVAELDLSKNLNAGNNSGKTKLGFSAHAVTGNYLNYDYSAENIERYIKILKNIGVSFLREDCYIENIKSANGLYVYPEWWDTFFETAARHGIEIILCLNAYSYPTDTSAIAQFADFAAVTARKYEGKVNLIELFNETNYSRVTDGAGYTEMLKTVYPAIKSINSDYQVITGVLSGADTAYTEEILKAGGANYMDAFSFHPYTYPLSPETADFTITITRMHDLFTKYTSKDIPFYLTEIGWTAAENNYGVSEEKKAEYHIRALSEMDALDYVKAYCIYETHSWPDAYSLEGNWGALSAPWCDYKDGTPYSAKPLYTALAAHSALSAEFSYTGNLKLNENVNINVYEAAGKKLYIINTDDINGTVGLKLKENAGRLFDINGNETGPSYSADCSAAVFNMNGDVKYLLLSADNEIQSVTFSTEQNGIYNISAAQEDNVLSGGGFEDGTWTPQDVKERTTETDNSQGFKDNSSVKITFGNRDGSVMFLEKYFTEETVSKMALNTRYCLRIAAKATEGFKGQIFIRVIETETGRNVKPTGYNGEWYLAGKAYDASASGDVSLPTDWGTFIAGDFAMTGAVFKMQVCVNGSGGTVWLDDIALVPVETNPIGGKVFGSYNKESRKFTLTVKADNGCRLKDIKLFSGIGDKLEAEPLFKGYNSNYESVYEYSIDDITVEWYHLAALPDVLTEFEKIPDCRISDADENGVTDIRDLIRTKKYLCEFQNKSPLYSADINGDGIVNAVDIGLLRTMLLVS